ncbi:MAG: RidA family protein [Bacteroidales bacterium]|nr:RidA family protein [Bacteroidales bacterium]
MKKIISTTKAPGALGPYSQAVEANGTLYISGTLPIDPKTGQLYTGDIKIATKMAMENIKAILEEAGYGFEHVVKYTCLLKDLNNFAGLNEVVGEYYSINPPARATFQVAKLPLDADVEIETIAVR